MSKSRRAFSPGSIRSGHRLADLEKARNERETSNGSRVRLLEWAYMGDPQMRQPAFLQYCCNPPWTRLGAPFRTALDGLSMAAAPGRSTGQAAHRMRSFTRPECKS